MSTSTIIKSLVAAGRAEDYAAVAAIPGASVHAEVLRFADSLRQDGLARIEELSARDRTAFAKALAVYENTAGGLGSVTALGFLERPPSAQMSQILQGSSLA